LPLLIGVCVAAVVTLVSVLVFIQGKGTIAGKRILDDNSNPLSAINNVSSSQNNCSVAVKGNIRSEPASFRNNVVKSVGGEQLLVTGKQTEGGWIEVKLADNKLGWAHKDVISNEAEMDFCLQQKGIPIKKVDDIPRPVPIVPSQNRDTDNTYKYRNPSSFSPYRKSRNNSDD
jgi:serine/threonine-protein kinase